jgi:hypothetical protein
VTRPRSRPPTSELGVLHAPQSALVWPALSTVGA